MFLPLQTGQPVLSIRFNAEFSDKVVTVYNFEVTDFHSYYVTDTGVLVYNASLVQYNKKATESPAIRKETYEWDRAVNSIKQDGNTSFRTETATEAKMLLQEGRGNMNRYKVYTHTEPAYKKGV